VLCGPVDGGLSNWRLHHINHGLYTATAYNGNRRKTPSSGWPVPFNCTVRKIPAMNNAAEMQINTSHCLLLSKSFLKKRNIKNVDSKQNSHVSINMVEL